MLALQHIHPVLVHFPIVFMLTLAVFDIVALMRGAGITQRTAAGNASTGLAVLAGAFAIVTYMFGDMALEIAEAGGFHSEVAEIHEGLGEMTAVAFAVWALVRVFLWWRNIRLGGASVLVPLVEIAGSAMVVATAYYGGQLVYGLGVNVARLAS